MTTHYRFQAPADDNAGGGGGKVDLGDDHVATVDGDDEAEEVDDDDEAEDEPAAKPPSRAKPVPGERVAELVSKAETKARAEMRAELDALRAEMSGLANAGNRRVSPVTQLRNMEAKAAELEDAYQEFVFAGKKDEAKSVRAQQRSLDVQIADYKVDMRAAAAQTGAAEDVRFQVLLDDIEARYPELNPDGDDFDRTKETEVSELVDGLVAKGLAKDVALKRAVKYVLGERRGGKGGELDPEKDPKLARTVEARRRAAEATSRQPANAEGLGRAAERGDDKKVDLSRKITPEAFKRYSALDESSRSKLRGD